MKLRLLLLSLFFCGFVFAQLPTANLTRSYDFTNGSFADAAIGDNLTQTGTALTNESDRFSIVDNSISLNGDYLSTTNFSFTDFSISFWIKTDINDDKERTIIDKSSRTNPNFGGTNTGFYIYLKDGRIGFKARRKTVFSDANNIVYIDTDRFFNEFVSNNNWHHITLTIKKGATQFGTANGGRNTFPYTYNYYVDGILEQSSGEEVKVKGIFSGGDYSNGGVLNIGNINSGGLTSDNNYAKNIDDLNIYSRVLTDAEVTQLTLLNNYTICETPDISNVSVTNITENSVDIAISGSDTYDVAYGLKSQPFPNYTILNNIPQNSFTLNNLEGSSLYNIQYRKVCAGNTTYNTTSSWSTPLEFLTEGPMYVNNLATGLNDGSSWTNAFTNLQDALLAVKENGEIWVSKGTYKPDASDRNATYLINKDNIKLFGGFAGTETTTSERDITTNETILSGDLLDNDSGTIDFAEATMSDNSHHIISIEKNGAVVDGFTISNANAIGASDASGAVIYVKKNIGSLPLNITGFTVKNSKIKNNLADNGVFFYYTSSAYSSITRNILVENTIVENNLSRYGIIHIRKTNANLTNVKIYNSLFKENVIKDNGGTKGQGGSVIWLLANNIPTSQIVNLDISNCTIINNQDLGTNAALNNFTRTPIMLLNLASLETKINNTIFWNNTTIGGSNSRTISSGDQANYGTLEVNNSISNLDFANQSTSEKNNTSNSDPLFTSPTDFTLQVSSPAIDAGNNSKIPNGLFTDLLGKNRIHNSTVDLGVYEFGAGVFTPRNLVLNSANGTVATNPESTSGIYADGIDVVLTATPNTGFQFNGWSGDATGTTNPLTITMNADKTITANFVKTRIFVDVNATGNNDGSSWTNAYTSLATALTDNTGIADFWIAKGIYKPGALGTDSFIIKENQHIFGGFNGTETNLSERNFQTNKTILSGDLNDNDNGVLTFNATYNENSLSIITTNGDNIIIDGVTIKGGSSSGSSAISINNNTQNLTFRNTIFSDNRAKGNSIINVAPRSTSATEDYDYNFENCLFENNVGRLATVMYVSSPELNGGFKVNTKFTNSIFTNNKVIDFNSSNSRGVNALFWFRGDLSLGEQTAIFVNNTFVNNTFNGTDGANSGIISASRIQGSVSIEIYNTIFWNNLLTNGDEKQALNLLGTQSPANSTIVKNSLDPLNFSLGVNVTENNISSDPQFIDLAIGDYRLRANSPAINTGNNSFLPASITEDFIGNSRILGSSIDMGAIEHDPSDVIVIDRILAITSANGSVVTNPNPINGTYADGTVVTLTASANAGFKFIEWTGDLTGTTNPLDITIDADKNITAVFSAITGIPDANFEQKLINLNLDDVLDGQVLTSNINTINSLDIRNSNIADLTGINDFASLHTLFAMGNQLTTLDLSARNSLTSLYLDNNQLTSLTLGNLVSLDYLGLENNNFTALVLPSSLTDLKRLNVSNNNLTNLDVTNFTGLEELIISATLVETIDLSKNAILNYFTAFSSKLTSLDFTSNTDILSVYVGGQDIISLDLRNGNLAKIGNVETDTAPNLTCIFVDDDASPVLNNWVLNANNNIFETDAQCTSLSTESISQFNFDVYPNPTKGFITINSTENIKQASIYNLIGKKIDSFRSKEIDLTSLSKGIYFLKIELESGKISIKKIIKN